MKFSFPAFCLLLLPIALTTIGCGGSTETSVSAPPVVTETPEETAAKQQAYADEQAKMRERDQQSSN
jgi:hypothetical protein